MAKISATGMAVNLMLGFREKNQTAYASIARFAAENNVATKGDKFTQYISDNKSRAREWVDADLKKRAKNRKQAQDAIINSESVTHSEFPPIRESHPIYIDPPKLVVDATPEMRVEPNQDVQPSEPVVEPTPYAHDNPNDTAQLDSTSVPEQILNIKPVTLAKQETRLENGKEVNRVKTERVVYFPDIKDRSNRKFLSLEKPFVDALDVIAPSKEKRNIWLNTVLAGDPDHAAAIVRNTLVTTLLAKWVQP